MANVVDELFAIAFVFRRRAFQDFARSHAAIFHRRQATGVNGFGHQRAGHAVIESKLAHPFAGAFCAGFVHDFVDEPAVAVFVLYREDVARDFDEVAIELAAVPFGKDVVQLIVREAERFFHHEVGFADELHIAVFDAVVDHLHIMAGAAWADPLAAGDVVLGTNFRCDRLKDRLHGRPGCRAAAGHHAGAFERAFFAARDARADVQQAFGFHFLGAALGIGVIACCRRRSGCPLFRAAEGAF